MKLNKLIFASLALAATIPAGAVRALDRFVTITQPDGSVVSVKRCGDEFSHFSVTTDNVLLAEQGDAFYYGKLDKSGSIISTGILAADPAGRSSMLSQQLTVMTPELAEKIHAANRRTQTKKVAQSGMGRFRSNFPTEGDIKSVVILVSYQDINFNVADPYGYFNGLLNTDGFSQYDATGCVAEYFRFNSNNLFRPEFTVLGPVVLPFPRSYYGANNSNGNDKAAYQMVVHAVEQLDDSVDFSQFDMDGDGVVDNIYVIYAGEGEASGGIASSVWPHSWALSYAGTHLEADGVVIDGYGCSNEWFDNRPDGMGTFTHEFSHVIGLPDLYSTDYGNSLYATPGPWSVMDYGPYLNNSHTPPNYSAYERLALGWIEPQIINGPESVTLENLADSNKACIISASNETEYYLFENRQQTGWDAYLPASGMLIWHVDYVKSVFENNRLNNDRRHMYVELKKASNVDDARNDDVFPGWCWPGPYGKTEFTDETQPSMLTWSGESLQLPLTEISHSNGLITFKVAEGRDPILPPQVLAPVNKGAGWFEARWNPAANATDYYLTVMKKVMIEPDKTAMADMGTGTELSLPDGWKASASTVYTTSGNYGASAPSYKMSNDNCTISSPVYEKDITKISFWYKGINCDGELEVTGIGSNGESMAITSLRPSKQSGQTEIIDNVPAGVRQVIFTYKKNTGNIALDDIELTITGSVIEEMPEHQRISTGGKTEYRIEYPFEENTSYLYYVEATDGDFISRRSEMMEVAAENSGVNTVKTDSIGFHQYGRALYFTEETEVYTLTGQLIFKGTRPFTLPSSGIYMLRQGKKVAKIATN